MQLVMWKYYRHKNNLQLNFINLVEYTECRQANCLEREKRKVKVGKRERRKKEEEDEEEGGRSEIEVLKEKEIPLALKVALKLFFLV